MKLRNAWISAAFLILVVVGAGVGSGSAFAKGDFSISSSVGTAKLANGVTLSGSVAWKASLSGARIAKVVFSIDGTDTWTDPTAPYQFNGDPNGVLDTSRLTNGQHTLAVKAYATDGPTVTKTASVKIASGSIQATAFVVGSSIANGATLSGSLPWTASPSGSPLSKVEFLIDGALKWTESFAPYQFNGHNAVLDTSTLSNGAHMFAVIAYATDGRTASASSSVTVANASPPPAPSSSPPPPPPPPPPSSPPSLTTLPTYGVSLGGKSLFRPPLERQFELDQIAAAVNGHPAVVRMDSTPGNQPWMDPWVADVFARGLEPMLILFGTTGPVDAKSAANFASAQGAKWRGRIRLYEFANEPDLNGWTPEQYTASLKAAYVALKVADPSAILIAGALWKWDAGPAANPAGGARDWVKRMYAAGAKGYFDMLSLHLYDDPDFHGSWNLWDQAFTMSPSIRSIMDANGDQSMPIISTETGGPATKYGDTGQATIVDHDFNHLYSGQIAMCLFYTMLNDDVPGFGFLRDDRSKRPAWYTLHQRTT